MNTVTKEQVKRVLQKKNHFYLHLIIFVTSTILLFVSDVVLREVPSKKPLFYFGSILLGLSIISFALGCYFSHKQREEIKEAYPDLNEITSTTMIRGTKPTYFLLIGMYLPLVTLGCLLLNFIFQGGIEECIPIIEQKLKTL